MSLVDRWRFRRALPRLYAKSLVEVAEARRLLGTKCSADNYIACGKRAKTGERCGLAATHGGLHLSPEGGEWRG